MDAGFPHCIGPLRSTGLSVRPQPYFSEISLPSVMVGGGVVCSSDQL